MKKHLLYLASALFWLGVSVSTFYSHRLSFAAFAAVATVLNFAWFYQAARSYRRQ